MHRPHTAAQLVLLVTAAVFINYIDGGNLATVLLPADGAGATGRWVGEQNAAGSVAGLIAPVITGILVDRTGLFDVAFGLARRRQTPWA